MTTSSPLGSGEFQDFFAQFSGSTPLKEGAAEKAGHIYRQLKNMPSKEKADTIKLVQQTLQGLHTKLSDLKASGAPHGDVPEKIEVLRTVLFGAKLAQIPSYQRFKVMVELANRFADRLAKHPEKACTAALVQVNGENYDVWKLPEHFLLLGCADSLPGMSRFSDRLLDANYHETLCISAVNEKTGYFQEKEKAFLVLHVDPNTVVHTQEQDIRSPRYSEDAKFVRTEWYDAARRLMSIAAEIDTASHALQRLLPNSHPPYTDLDSYNRLLVQVEKRKAGLSLRAKEVLLREFYELTPAMEERIGNALDRASISSRTKVDVYADKTTIHSIMKQYGIEGPPASEELSRVLEAMISLEEQQIVLSAFCLQRLKGKIPDETFVELENLHKQVWAKQCFSDACSAVRNLEKQQDITTLKEAFFALKNVSAIPYLSQKEKEGVANLLMHVEYELMKVAKEDLSPTNCYQWMHDLGMEGSFDYYAINVEIEERVEKLEKKLKKSGKNVPDDLFQEFLAITLPASESMEEALTRILAKSPIAALESFKEDYLFIHDPKRYSVSDKDKKEFIEVMARYNEVLLNLKVEVRRYEIIDALEKLPPDKAPKEREFIIKLLRGEIPPLTDSDEDRERAIELQNTVHMAGVGVPRYGSKLEFYPLLQGKNSTRDMLSEPLDVTNYPHIINRPQLELGYLLRTLFQLYEGGKLEERLKVLEEAEMTGSDEYKELTSLTPKSVYEALFPAEAKAVADSAADYKQLLFDKLTSLQADLKSFPKEFAGRDVSGIAQRFRTMPETLRAPQEIVAQTDAAISPHRYDWNEINLDIEASGGGKSGGVYPTAILLSEKLFKGAATLHRDPLQKVLEYAKAHSLPVFVKA